MCTECLEHPILNGHWCSYYIKRKITWLCLRKWSSQKLQQHNMALLQDLLLQDREATSKNYKVIMGYCIIVFYFNLWSCIHFPWDHRKFDWELLKWLTALIFQNTCSMVHFSVGRGIFSGQSPWLSSCIHCSDVSSSFYSTSLHMLLPPEFIWTFWSWHFLEMFSSVAFLHHNYLMRFLQLSTITGKGSFIYPQSLIITHCVRQRAVDWR